MIQIFNYGQVDQKKIFARVVPEMDVEAIVSQIIRDVRKGKDQSVIEYCRRFDQVDLRTLEVTDEEIAEAIMTQVPRGVTFLEAQGGYSKQPGKVITVIARQYESSKIFRLVNAIDPNAFVSQSQVRGVFGQGFDPIQNNA